MKEFLNRKECDDGSLIIKFKKMGCDIDTENNHRIRGIVPTKDGKNLFIELSDGHRFEYNKSNFPYLSKQDYLKRYPYKNYLYCEGCFRVDVPEDYFLNYTKEFDGYDRKCFYNINYNKKGIIEFLQKINNNIKDIELVDEYYIDDFCNQSGFYRLYDERLNHSMVPSKITYMNDYNINVDVNYICYNYDNSVKYSEIKNIRYQNYDRNELDKIYGKEIMDSLIEKYQKHIKELINNIKDNKDLESKKLGLEDDKELQPESELEI